MRFPFSPFPQGWYVVGYTDDFPVGQARPLRYFGKDLVGFRGEGGRVALLDAYCPHLGAHLGHGGCVVGDSVQCPFHGWRFDGAGACVEVPNAKKIPPRAATRSWPVAEQHGLVFAWHHPEDAAPGWQPPEIAELDAPEWLAPERKLWTVRSHVKEMGENNCDRAHLLFVHKLLAVDSEAEAEAHQMRVLHRFKAEMTRLGMPGTIFDGEVRGLHSGLGVIQQRIISFGPEGTGARTPFVEGLLVAMNSPVDEDSVDLRFSFTVKKHPDENFARMAAAPMWQDLVRDVEDDIRIWEKKVYLERPLLTDADGPIGMFRKWARQF